MTNKSAHKTRNPKAGHKSRGQNLVEFAVTIPLVLAMFFFILEMGRVWFVYEAAKMAANDGSTTAAKYHNADAGTAQAGRKITEAGLTGTGTVAQVDGKHAYEATITVTYEPFFAGLSIPTLGGQITLIPAGFDINYTQVSTASVY